MFQIGWSFDNVTLPFLQCNLNTKTKILDRPDLDQFSKEVSKGYDFVGISFNTMEIEKAAYMINIIKKISPSSKIVLGGCGVYTPGTKKLGADYICKGLGVKFLRKLLGERVDRPIVHPKEIYTHLNPLRAFKGLKTRTSLIVPSFGCPNHCEFCHPSAIFGRSEFLNAKEMYELILSTKLKSHIILDDNFFVNRERAKEFFDLIKNEDIQVGTFTDFNNLLKLDIDKIANNIFGLFLGVESMFWKSPKRGKNIREVIHKLHDNGVIVVTSHVYGLDYQTRDIVKKELDYAISLDSDIYQFAIVTPYPGTPFYNRLKKGKKLFKMIPWSHYDCAHLVFKHPHLERLWLREFLFKSYEAVPSTYTRALKHLKIVLRSIF
jgi:radical SAM superfamily enzyme YgiQ (UPF0313 family)